MNSRTTKSGIAVLALTGFLMCEMRGVAATSPDGASAGAAGPRIEFASTVLDIGKVIAGQVINHDFVFTNTGGQTLEITEVQPTCGCTMAGVWDHRVEPGRTGHIPIRYTASYVGGEISKTVIVYCNDPARTNVVLHINGAVWEPVEVTPVYVMFGANSDRVTNETKVVRIVNNTGEPLTVTDPKSPDSSFQVSLKIVKPGKEYELDVTLTPPLTAGNFTVPITVKTSSSSLPVATVTAFATVGAAVTALPGQIILPEHLSPTGAVSRVTIQNNGTKPITVSDAEVNFPGVQVQVQEVQSGSTFVVTAMFPPGFHTGLDQRVELQVKTSHPQFPVLKVPVFQSRSLADLLNPTGSPSAAASSPPVKP